MLQQQSRSSADKILQLKSANWTYDTIRCDTRRF